MNCMTKATMIMIYVHTISDHLKIDHITYSEMDVNGEIKFVARESISGKNATSLSITQLKITYLMTLTMNLVPTPHQLN